MNPDKARAIAADVLVNGVTTKHRLAELREARLILELTAMLYSDPRPEQGAMLILDCVIDTLTTLTTEA